MDKGQLFCVLIVSVMADCRKQHDAIKLYFLLRKTGTVTFKMLKMTYKNNGIVKNTVSLTKSCLKQNGFQFDGCFCKQ